MHDHRWGQCAVRCLAEFQPSMRAASWKKKEKKIRASLACKNLRKSILNPSILRGPKVCVFARHAKKNAEYTREIFTKFLSDLSKCAGRSKTEYNRGRWTWNKMKHSWVKRGERLCGSLSLSLPLIRYLSSPSQGESAKIKLVAALGSSIILYRRYEVSTDEVPGRLKKVQGKNRLERW